MPLWGVKVPLYKAFGQKDLSSKPLTINHKYIPIMIVAVQGDYKSYNWHILVIYVM